MHMRGGKHFTTVMFKIKLWPLHTAISCQSFIWSICILGYTWNALNLCNEAIRAGKRRCSCTNLYSSPLRCLFWSKIQVWYRERKKKKIKSYFGSSELHHYSSDTLTPFCLATGKQLQLNLLWIVHFHSFPLSPLIFFSPL